ncbi:pyridoxamine 5'-phosphate oxidase family protein [Paenibacillus thermoaerophilus]|uniref:Pyridoxamine 5'-phosphate oxidase family protein n=1 Tax=Paenibacillus thermoaerophilus TaxID=1215385 RepID=A0ABW2V0Z7_9BACL|nr:pyridoxamine 5'-phosphate oxidase family protein [Paenibacillus thermoaerophilus]TMV19053.1 hypothetical protein FE781_00645 [Paenibacillus thermoaerophilus]
MAETITALSEALQANLRQEKLVLLSTIDSDSGAPTVSAISWVYAPDGKRVRFAIDARSRLVANLRGNPSATLTLFAEGSVHAIYGTARILSEALEGVPFKLACFELEVDAVRDAMFYGARLTVEPAYEKTYNKAAAEKLDGQVFAAMEKA